MRACVESSAIIDGFSAIVFLFMYISNPHMLKNPSASVFISPTCALTSLARAFLPPTRAYSLLTCAYNH